MTASGRAVEPLSTTITSNAARSSVWAFETAEAGSQTNRLIEMRYNDSNQRLF